jgi:hypothetical protein
LDEFSNFDLRFSIGEGNIEYPTLNTEVDEAGEPGVPEPSALHFFRGFGMQRKINVQHPTLNTEVKKEGLNEGGRTITITCTVSGQEDL